MTAKQKVFTVAAVVAIVLTLGIAGRMDYTEQVLYTMPDKAYSEIRDTLGEDASDYEIARYYVKNYKE